MNELARRMWLLVGLEGRLRCPASTNCSVGQPLAFGADDGEVGALPVVNAQFDPVRVAEIELGQVAVQMGFRHLEVDAVDAALEDAEVAFEPAAGVLV